MAAVSSVQLLSHALLFATPCTAACYASLFITNSWGLLKLMSIESVIHATISSNVIPYSSCLQYFQASGSFQMSHFFTSGGHILEFQLQYQYFQWTFRTDFLSYWLVWSPCSPRDSQESSPTPQFKSINSLVPTFLYGSTLKSIHDHLKNHNCALLAK